MEIVKDLVSIIMSNYNTPEIFLQKAIESILNQSYQNFEYIIIDDCSTDESLSIIQSYSDDRIKILKNEENLGITKSLNKGLSVAKGEFIARMDADDICYPKRFEKQVEFLKSHPDHIVCGTWIEQIDGNGKKQDNKEQCKIIPEKEIFRINLLFGNHPNIVHPTAMFNHKLLLENDIKYDEKYLLAQDYRMWVTCSGCAECANVPEILLQYRVHGKAVSKEKKEMQKKCAVENMKEQLKGLDMELSEEYEDVHVNFLSLRHSYDLKYKQWIKKIIRQNKKYHVYNEKKLNQILWSKWAEITYFALRKQDKIGDRIKIMMNFPIIHIDKIWNIRKERKTKYGTNK